MAAAGSLRRRGFFMRTTAVLATTIAVHAAALVPSSHRQYHHHHAFVLPACAHGRQALTPRRPPFLAPPTTANAARQAFHSSSPTARGSPRDDDGQEDRDDDGGDQQPILIDIATRACWPELSEAQWDKLEGLANLLQEVNARINVISRKDFVNVVPNHILPALGLARLLHKAPKGTRVLDIGTGGGFPGLPLAIACPQLDLVLVDATGKKVRAVQAMAEALGLTDRVQTAHARIEELGGRRFEYVVGRSVTAMPRFLQWARPKLLVPKPQSQHSKAGAEGEKEERKGGVPAPGVLYITGLEPMAPAVNKEADEELEEAPEPDSVTMIRDLMAPAYTGDKAVFHFSAARLLQGRVYETADDGRRTFVRSRRMYDDGGRFRPEGEGLFAQAMREGRRDGFGGDEDMWGGEDGGFGRGDRDGRWGGRGRRGPPRSGGRGGGGGGGYGGGGGGYGDRRRSGGGGPGGGGGGGRYGGGGSRGGRPGTGMGGGSAGGGKGGGPPRGRSGPPR